MKNIISTKIVLSILLFGFLGTLCGAAISIILENYTHGLFGSIGAGAGIVFGVVDGVFLRRKPKETQQIANDSDTLHVDSDVTPQVTQGGGSAKDRNFMLSVVASIAIVIFAPFNWITVSGVRQIQGFWGSTIVTHEESFNLFTSWSQWDELREIASELSHSFGISADEITMMWMIISALVVLFIWSVVLQVIAIKENHAGNDSYTLACWGYVITITVPIAYFLMSIYVNDDDIIVRPTIFFILTCVAGLVGLIANKSTVAKPTASGVGYCSSCGQRLPGRSAAFCASCGAKVNSK
ncbi:MAG: hypothetical protein FWB80_05225 [Defluviitaleaceae bacterium]|nr:hypothetical protein [Defluviitaleaceae bacterium]